MSHKDAILARELAERIRLLEARLGRLRKTVIVTWLSVLSLCAIALSCVASGDGHRQVLSSLAPAAQAQTPPVVDSIWTRRLVLVDDTGTLRAELSQNSGATWLEIHAPKSSAGDISLKLLTNIQPGNPYAGGVSILGRAPISSFTAEAYGSGAGPVVMGTSGFSASTDDRFWARLSGGKVYYDGHLPIPWRVDIAPGVTTQQ
jgi:hypothetical protein